MKVLCNSINDSCDYCIHTSPHIESEIKPSIYGRHCDVSSHNFHMEGFFHRFMESEGTTYALVENLSGNIERYDMSYHGIRFKER